MVRLNKSAGLQLLAVLMAFNIVLRPSTLTAAPIAVRHKEGVAHGFLVLRTLDGKILAAGGLIQVMRDDQVTIDFTLRFKDGSLHHETTIYSGTGSLSPSEFYMGLRPTHRHEN
jgi:hypothetical protein